MGKKKRKKKFKFQGGPAQNVLIPSKEEAIKEEDRLSQETFFSTVIKKDLKTFLLAVLFILIILALLIILARYVKV